MCHFFYVLFFSCKCNGTLQNVVGSHHTLYMMRPGQADVMSVFSGLLGFTSHSCDETWAGWCFSVQLVVFKVTASS